MNSPLFGCEAHPYVLADGRLAIALKQSLVIVREQSEPVLVPPVVPWAPPTCESLVGQLPVARFRGALSDLWTWVKEDEEVEDVFRRLSNGMPRPGRLCGVRINRDLLWLGLITAEAPPDSVVVVELVGVPPGGNGTAHEVLRIRGWSKGQLPIVAPITDEGISDPSLDLEAEASA